MQFKAIFIGHKDQTNTKTGNRAPRYDFRSSAELAKWWARRSSLESCSLTRVKICSCWFHLDSAVAPLRWSLRWQRNRSQDQPAHSTSLDSKHIANLFPGHFCSHRNFNSNINLILSLFILHSTPISFFFYNQFMAILFWLRRAQNQCHFFSI